MPIRTIKPETWDDDKIDDLSHAGFRLFWFLVTHCDNYGVAPGHHRQLRRAFGRQKTPTECYLTELLCAGMVIVYEVDGAVYVFLRNFNRHQHIPADRMGRRKHPEPARATRIARAPARLRDVRKLRLVWCDVRQDAQLELGLDSGSRGAPKRDAGARRDREGIAKGSRRDREGIEMGSRSDLDISEPAQNPPSGEFLQNTAPMDQGSGIRDQRVCTLAPDGAPSEGNEPDNVVDLHPDPSLPPRHWQPPPAWIRALVEALADDLEPPPPTLEQARGFVRYLRPMYVAWHRKERRTLTEEGFILWMAQDWRGRPGDAYRRTEPEATQVDPDSRARAEAQMRAHQAKLDAELGIAPAEEA